MDSPWLSAPEQRAWRAYLRMETTLRARLNRQLQSDSALSLSDYEVLVALSEAPEQRARPHTISEALDWEQSRLSHQLTRMQRRGLVARERCPRDRRGFVIALTAAGEQALRAAAPGHAATVKDLMFAGLDDTLTAAFEQACQAIGDRVGSPACPATERGEPAGRDCPGAA